MSNGDGDTTESKGSEAQEPQRETVVTLLEKRNRERAAAIPERFPEPLELGPQYYAEPNLFRPPVPLDEYLKAAQQLEDFPPAHTVELPD